ncbi:MAG: hypothetical protein IJ196_05115 [Prevotella sp.]|nr:hypothetical protein [Prevotella sp.]
MNKMKRVFIPAIALLLAMVSCNKGDDDPRLIVITFDGLRWQEVFTGADSLLVGHPTFVTRPDTLTATYWRDTPEERREILMPFTWSYIVKHGYLLGNRTIGSQMQVANEKWFSYPGYSEDFCGYADNEHIESNDAVPNPNTSVLEVANRDPRYKGKVMMYGGWLSTRFAVNNDRGGFPGSVAYEANLSSHQDETMQLLDEMLQGMPRIRPENRYDAFNYAYAVETLKRDHPKVMWISFCETDHWAHSDKYDFYIEAIRKTDYFIRRIVETCEADPYYKGKTTYLITCDHGRGKYKAFGSHGQGVYGSNQTWLMAFGKGVERLGETSANGPFYNQQLAATIAAVLGIDFKPDNGVKQPPFDPHFKGEPIEDAEPKTEMGHFPAINATPKGQGVRYQYYEGNFQSVDELDKGKVVHSGILKNFSINSALQEDHFGFIFKTLLKIPKSGKYNLTCTSDDGSKVWIDGKLVIDNDGSHGTNPMEIYADLDQGYHRLEVKYFEDYEGQTFNIDLGGPDYAEDPIPYTMLYYE